MDNSKYITYPGGWTILADEQDKAMVDHAENNLADQWHNNFVDFLMTNYLNDKPRRTVIDAGASYGWMSWGFAKHFETVKAFELRQDVYQATRKNMEKLDNVEVFNYALSNKEGRVSYQNNIRTGFSKITSNYIEGEGYKPGYAYPLDHFNFKEVDCIKIDVEGHELEVVQGAIQTIEKCKPVMIIEMDIGRGEHSYNKRQAVFKLLWGLDYKVVDIRHHDIILVP